MLLLLQMCPKSIIYTSAPILINGPKTVVFNIILNTVSTYAKTSINCRSFTKKRKTSTKWSMYGFFTNILDYLGPFYHKKKTCFFSLQVLDNFHKNPDFENFPLFFPIFLDSKSFLRILIRYM